jgi:toxic protein SymE
LVVQQHGQPAHHNHYYQGIAIMTDSHSIADCLDPEVSPANNRLLTVSYARRHPGHSRVPALTMQGQWLEEAGFTTGTQVEIK